VSFANEHKERKLAKELVGPNYTAEAVMLTFQLMGERKSSTLCLHSRLGGQGHPAIGSKWDRYKLQIQDLQGLSWR